MGMNAHNLWSKSFKFPKIQAIKQPGNSQVFKGA